MSNGSHQFVVDPAALRNRLEAEAEEKARAAAAEKAEAGNRETANALRAKATEKRKAFQQAGRALAPMLGLTLTAAARPRGFRPGQQVRTATNQNRVRGEYELLGQHAETVREHVTTNDMREMRKEMSRRGKTPTAKDVVSLAKKRARAALKKAAAAAKREQQARGSESQANHKPAKAQRVVRLKRTNPNASAQ